MNKLIIDRSKWRTGDTGPTCTGNGSTLLLNNEGFMCCLGFEARRLRYEEDEIIGKCDPFDFEEYEEVLTNLREQDFLERHNRDFINRAIDINDDDETTSEEKEKKIIEHFKTSNVEVEFVGAYGLTSNPYSDQRFIIRRKVLPLIYKNN